MLVIDTTLLTIAFGAVALYYLALLVAAHLPSRRRLPPGRIHDFAFVVLIPCRDEELVIGDTLRSLPRRGRGLIALVIDDASSDATAAIAEAAGNGVVVLRRSPAEGGRGKGAALNAGFEVVRAARRGEGPLARLLPTDTDPDRIIVTVLDADGRFGEDALLAAARRLGEPDCGGVQIAVTIENSGDGLLPLMQDIEFIGFSQTVQRARDRFGSLGLGGNGQFVRYPVLDRLGARPWEPCLTEDLDLGLRVAMGGARLRFAHEAAVRQQGVVTWRSLVRQRTRWAQGHLSCWRHLPAIARSRRTLAFATRVDLSIYLVLIIMVGLVGLNLLVTLLSFTHEVAVVNAVAERLGTAGTWALTALGSLPALVFVAAQQRRSSHRLPVWALPLVVIAFALYTYMWIPAFVRAVGRMIVGRDDWVKTARVATVPAG